MTLDLARITLHLRPMHTERIPAYTGRAAEAWYLDALRQIDPALSEAIHDGSGRLKSFTTSGLLPLPRGELLTISPHQTVRLVITTLHTDLTRLTLNALLPNWKHVQLHEQPFQVERSEVETSSYADLLADSKASNQRRLNLDFVTPTVFKRTGDLQMPLPLPEYVFGSLIDRWAGMAPAEPLHPDLRVWVQKQVDIAHHRISTERVSFERANKGAMTGFTGRVGYRLHSSEFPFLDQIHVLAHYARFAGVGAKTTIGLGQVALWD